MSSNLLPSASLTALSGRRRSGWRRSSSPRLVSFQPFSSARASNVNSLPVARQEGSRLRCVSCTLLNMPPPPVLPTTDILPLPPFAVPFTTPPRPPLAIFPSYLFDVKAGPPTSVHPSFPGLAPSSPHIKFESTVAAWRAQKEALVGLGAGSAATARKRRKRRLREGAVIALVALLLAALVNLGRGHYGSRVDAWRTTQHVSTELADELAIEDVKAVEQELPHYTIHGGGLAPLAIRPVSLNDDTPRRPESTDFLPALDTTPPVELLFPHSRPRRTSATVVLPIPVLPSSRFEDLLAVLGTLANLTSKSIMLACPEPLVMSLNTSLTAAAAMEEEHDATLNSTLLGSVFVLGWSEDVPSTPHPIDGHALPLLHLLTHRQADNLHNETLLVLPALADLLASIPTASLAATLQPLLTYPHRRLQSAEHAPLFLAGARISASTLLPVVTGGEGADELVPVAFGVPPMLITSRLLRASVDGLRTTSDGSPGVWAALGERVVVPEGRGVGGWVVPSTSSFLVDPNRTDEDKASIDLGSLASLLAAQLASNSASAHPSQAHQSLHLTLWDPTPLSDRGHIALILPSLASLEILGSLACALHRTGHTVSIRLPYEDELSGEALGGTEGCWLRYEGGGAAKQKMDELEGDGVEVRGDGVYRERETAHVVIVGEGMEGELLAGVEDEAVRIVISAEDLEEGSGAGEVWDWVGTLGLSSLEHWHTPQIHLSIITSSRPASLTRLLTSLQSAHYLSTPTSTSPPVPLSISLERNSSPDTHAVVRDLIWPHGQVMVRHRVKQAGVMLAVTESWYPRTDHEYGILLEDDIELSPLFYAYAKYTILFHRYSPNPSPNLYGISLYHQRASELPLSGRRPFSASSLFASLGDANPNAPYLSQVPCSWGAVYFPETWRAFHEYLALRLAEERGGGGGPKRGSSSGSSSDLALANGTTKTAGPFQTLPNSRSSNWGQSWKRYLIDYLHLTSPSMMLYPNFPGDRSLSTNHLEPGAHVVRPSSSSSSLKGDDNSTSSSAAEWETFERKRKMFTVPLLPLGEGGLTRGLPGGRLLRWEGMRRTDWFGEVVSDGELGRRGAEARRRVEEECGGRGGEMEWPVCVGGRGKQGGGRERRRNGNGWRGVRIRRE